MNKNDLLDGIQERISKQDYTGISKIDGVRFIELKRFHDDGGSFLELDRLAGGISQAVSDFEIKQINWSQVHPKVIKASHLHFNQEDIWFVPPMDKILIGLKDLRKNSPSAGVTMRFILGEGKTRLLYIPRGVLHGYANPYNKDMALIYFVNQQFSPDAQTCDEYRMPYDEFGRDFWEISKG